MRILINRYFSSNLSKKPEENGASYLDIRDKPFDTSGGQGYIYEVTQIDNKKIDGLLVKKFDQGFPDNLKGIVDEIKNQKDIHKIDQCIALKALPLFLFEGTLNSGPFYGYVMRKAEGESFNKIIENDLDDYMDLPLKDRLQLCLQFVEGMHILYCLSIIHADVNGKNLIINMKKAEIAIIDLDGGAVAKSSSVPIMVKLEPGWIAPEIYSQMKNGKKLVDVKITADFWAVACGMHYILFGFSPFFFLAYYYDIERYLKTYKWPELEITGIETNKDNKGIFDHYERKYSEISGELKNLFQKSFQIGFLYPDKRIQPYSWKIAIKSQIESIKPQIEIETNKNFNFNLKPNILKSDFFIIKIKNIGNDILKGTIRSPSNWLKISQDNFNILPYKSQTIYFDISTYGISGNNSGKIIIESNGGNKTVFLNLSVEIPPPKMEINKNKNKKFFNFNLNKNISISDSFTIKNIGGKNLIGTIIKRKRKNWLTISQDNFNILPYKSQTINFDISTYGVPLGIDAEEIIIKSNAGDREIPINLTVEIPPVEIGNFKKKMNFPLIIIFTLVAILSKELNVIMALIGAIFTSFYGTKEERNKKNYFKSFGKFIFGSILLSSIFLLFYDFNFFIFDKIVSGIYFAIFISEISAKKLYIYKIDTNKDIIPSLQKIAAICLVIMISNNIFPIISNNFWRNSQPIPMITPNVVPTTTPNIVPMITPNIVPTTTPNVVPTTTPNVVPTTYISFVDGFSFYKVRNFDKPPRNFTYTNRSLNINRGDTIIWKNDAEAISLTVVSDQNLWNDDVGYLKIGEEFNYTFNIPGEYTIYIKNKPIVHQTIIVN